MTQGYESTPGYESTAGYEGTAGYAADPAPPSTTDVAKDQTRSVGEDAKEGGRHVAGVARDEARNVAGEAASQARDLWDQTRSELMEQSGQQQQRVAQGLRSLAEELSSMAHGSQQQGLASDVAGRGATHARKLADYLDQRDPGSLLDEVRGFARRRPGMFLALAAGAGVVGGRLSRGMMSHDDNAPAQGGTAPRPTTAATTGPPRTAWADATAAARDTRTRDAGVPLGPDEPFSEASP